MTIRIGKDQEFTAMEDLPGVNNEVAQRLRALGFNTLESIAVATSQELKKAGINQKQASKMISVARSLITVSFVRADELVEKRKNVSRLTTGSPKFDLLMGGGLEPQTITEFYGPFGSGKTQICLQLCVNVQLPLAKGGLEGSALYIDTENTFRIERIVKMAEYLKLDPQQVTKNIIYASAYTTDHQITLLANSDAIIKKNNIKLLIIDSLTSHFRSEYVGRENLVTRQQKLNIHLHKLIRLAKAFNIVAVVTNQVVTKPDSYFGDIDQPVGGNIVGHSSHLRVYLRKASRPPIRIARLVACPYLPEGEELFRITENGIGDVPKTPR